MASRVTTVVVDCRDPEALAGFWCAALGWEARERSPDDCEIAPPGQPDKGPVPTLLFQRVADPTPGKARLHLDLNAPEGNVFCLLESQVPAAWSCAHSGDGT
jgi:hypothetical protein